MKGQIQVQVRLVAKPEHVPEGKPAATYPGVVAAMGHLSDSSYKQILNMVDKRADFEVNKPELTDNQKYADDALIGLFGKLQAKILPIWLVFIGALFGYTALNAYRLKSKSEMTAKLPVTSLLKRIVVSIPLLFLLRYLKTQVHCFGCSEEEMEAKFGIPMLNKGNSNSVIFVEKRFISSDSDVAEEIAGLEPGLTHRLSIGLATTLAARHDFKFQSITRSSEWEIDALHVRIESEPARTVWLIKPENLESMEFVE